MQGLREQARLVHNRHISPVELVERHLRRIATVNPSLNAFSVLMAEQAEHEAHMAANSTAPFGPLHGVPVTVKDSFDVAGFPTLSGSRLRLGHAAAKDAFAVARLRQAGAIVLGKTNTPEFLRSYETDNHVSGRTNNPWDVSRTPGGSSGGEAAAIAAGFSAGGIGSDGGGSIRVPAHFCGIAGLKPTPGRISVTGHFPAISNPSGFASVVGPMARSADDLRLLFDVLVAYDPEDPYSVPLPPQPPASGKPRIGYWPTFYKVPVQQAVSEALQHAAKLLSDLGHLVELFEPKGSERAPNAWKFVLSELPGEFFRMYFRGRESEVHWTATELGAPEPPSPLTATDVLKQFAARDRMRAGMIQQMRDQDCTVLLTPVCGTVAFQHQQRSFETGGQAIGLFQAMMPALIWNLYGFPALTIPMHQTTDGLPVGIQLVGLPWSDETLLDIAVRLEEARGPWTFPSLGQSDAIES